MDYIPIGSVEAIERGGSNAEKKSEEYCIAAGGTHKVTVEKILLNLYLDYRFPKLPSWSFAIINRVKIE